MLLVCRDRVIVSVNVHSIVGDMTRWYQRGSTTLWVVVFLVIFAVLLTASLQFVTRQSHATIVQEQEEQAFAAAEAGLHHVLWLLNSGTETITSLPGKTIVDEPMTNKEGEVVARFSITFSNATPQGIVVTAVGSDAVRADICQSINADIAATPAGGYIFTRWDHILSPVCATAAGSAAVLDPAGGRIITTSLSLQEHNLTKPLEAAETVHRYIISVDPKDVPADIRIKVSSNSFTPALSLKDPSGTEVAYAGQEWRLAHVRYEAAVRRWQENLTASIGRGLGGPTCDSSQYLACIPRDLESHNTWFTLVSPGLYQLDITSVDTTRGTYTLKTEKR